MPIKVMLLIININEHEARFPELEILRLFGEGVILLRHFTECMQRATLSPSEYCTAGTNKCDFIIQPFTITQHLNEIKCVDKSLQRNDYR